MKKKRNSNKLFIIYQMFIKHLLYTEYCSRQWIKQLSNVGTPAKYHQNDVLISQSWVYCLLVKETSTLMVSVAFPSGIWDIYKIWGSGLRGFFSLGGLIGIG